MRQSDKPQLMRHIDPAELDDPLRGGLQSKARHGPAARLGLLADLVIRLQLELAAGLSHQYIRIAVDRRELSSVDLEATGWTEANHQLIGLLTGQPWEFQRGESSQFGMPHAVQHLPVMPETDLLGLISHHWCG